MNWLQDCEKNPILSARPAPLLKHCVASRSSQQLAQGVQRAAGRVLPGRAASTSLPQLPLAFISLGTVEAAYHCLPSSLHRKVRHRRQGRGGGRHPMRDARQLARPLRCGPPGVSLIRGGLVLAPGSLRARMGGAGKGGHEGGCPGEVGGKWVGGKWVGSGWGTGGGGHAGAPAPSAADHTLNPRDKEVGALSVCRGTRAHSRIDCPPASARGRGARSWMWPTTNTASKQGPGWKTGRPCECDGHHMHAGTQAPGTLHGGAHLCDY